MATSYDAVVIGAGIIGAATALSLSRGGRRVLVVDKLPASGYGSTSGSCAIVRPFYSTVEGSALAYESHFYWMEWADFVGKGDERGLARYVNCGNLVVRCPRNKYLNPILAVMREIGCPYRELNAAEVKQRLPIVTLGILRSAAPAGGCRLRHLQWRDPSRRGLLPDRGLCHRSPAGGP